MRRSTPGSGITCTSESTGGLPAAITAVDPTTTSPKASKSHRSARMSCFTAKPRRSQAGPALGWNPASMRKLFLVVALVVTTVTPLRPVTAAPPVPSSLPLSFVADLPLPRNATRFDYQSVDADHRRLYIAHLGDSSLLVFDLDGQRVIQEVPGLPSVHGVVPAPEQHLLFATATAEKTLAIIDDQTLQVKSRVPAGAYPNGLAYDPASGRAFISNNTGRGVAVVDVKN